MNIKDTEKLIELLDSILNMFEMVPTKDPTGYNNFMWLMMYDMMTKPIVIMQNILYLHLDALKEKENAHSGTNENDRLGD